MQNKTSWFGGLLLVVYLFLGTFFSGCGGDNAHDGKTGLTGGSGGVGTGDALSSIQKNIFQKNINEFVDALNTLESNILLYDENLTETDTDKLQILFVELIPKWKAVESTYVAGDYDSSLIDSLRYIEYFIKASKKQNIPADVQDALNSTGKLDDLLFKNTSKSMRALEYLIFDTQKSPADLVILMNRDNRRRIDALKIVLASLKSRTAPILNFYKNDTLFVSDTTDALNSLVNVLVDSAFNLREKRIGEPAGFVVKTKDNPRPSTLEYYNSKSSINSVIAILNTHKAIMGESSYKNLGSFASENGAADIVASIRENIDKSLGFANQINSLEDAIASDPMDSNVKKLYDEVELLQSNYFSSLIDSLDLTAKIIDADGD